MIAHFAFRALQLQQYNNFKMYISGSNVLSMRFASNALVLIVYCWIGFLSYQKWDLEKILSQELNY